MTARVAGHFGEWLQGRLGPDGPVVLVTVPCHKLTVTVEYVADGPLHLDQDPTILSVSQAKGFLASVGGSEAHYRLQADMPPGGGAGASTAALLALAQAAGGDPSRMTEACLAAEGASDPLMLHDPASVLWAPRAGRSLRALPALPKAEIVGGFWGAALRTDPQDSAFPDVSDLADTLSQPVSPQTLAEVASESARRCTVLRGPSEDPTQRLTQELGALGYLRAHTGSARGLIFAPGAVPDQAEGLLACAGFSHVLRFQTGGHP